MNIFLAGSARNVGAGRHRKISAGGTGWLACVGGVAYQWSKKNQSTNRGSSEGNIYKVSNTWYESSTVLFSPHMNCLLWVWVFEFSQGHPKLF